jgi:hypothetical protein
MNEKVAICILWFKQDNKDKNMKKAISLLIVLSLILSTCGRSNESMIKRNAKLNKAVSIPVRYLHEVFLPLDNAQLTLKGVTTINIKDLKESIPQGKYDVNRAYYSLNGDYFPLTKEYIDVSEGVTGVDIVCSSAKNEIILFPSSNSSQGLKQPNQEKTKYTRKFSYKMVLGAIVLFVALRIFNRVADDGLGKFFDSFKKVGKNLLSRISPVPPHSGRSLGHYFVYPGNKRAALWRKRARKSTKRLKKSKVVSKESSNEGKREKVKQAPARKHKNKDVSEYSAHSGDERAVPLRKGAGKPTSKSEKSEVASKEGSNEGKREKAKQAPAQRPKSKDTRRVSFVLNAAESFDVTTKIDELSRLMNTSNPNEDRVLGYIDDFYSNSAVDSIPDYLCGNLLAFFVSKVKATCSAAAFSAMDRQRVIEFLMAIVKINMEGSLSEDTLQLVSDRGINFDEWQP